MYNVNRMLIYFLLCCVYGNFLIRMEFNFLIKKVLKCIIALYFSLLLECSRTLEVSFPWENRSLFEEECWRSAEVFCGSFYYVCGLCMPLCFPFLVSTSVWCLPPCTGASPTTWPSSAARTHSSHPNRRPLILLRASNSTLGQHTPDNWSLTGTNRQTFWL